MFRRKNKHADETAAPPADTAEVPVEGMAVTDATAMPDEAAPAEPVAESAPAERMEFGPEADSAASEPAAAPQAAMAADSNGAHGNGANGNGRRGLKLGELMSEPPKMSEEQRQQAAAAELMSVIAPSQQMLMEQVPDASSPDDAAHRLMDRQNERPVLADPEADNLRGGDIYRTEATVYYRLQKRFTWGPQRGPYKDRWRPTTLSEPANDTSRRRLPRGR